MAEFIQSNGRIGVLQHFMFENEALLDKIPGIDIDRKVIGGKTGEVDDILGKGTASAIEAILIAAGVPEGSAFDADAQNKLNAFLIERDMDAGDVATFVKDVEAVITDKDLGPIYQRNATADGAAIHKALETEQKTPEPAPVQEEIKPDPEPVQKEKTAPKENYTGEKMLAEKEVLAPKSEAPEPMREGVAISTMALNPKALVNEEGQIVEPQEKPVITQEEYASIVEEYGIDKEHVVLAPMHKPTVMPADMVAMAAHDSTIKIDAAPVTRDLGKIITGDELVAASIFPSFKGIGVPFLKADQNTSRVALDIDKGDGVQLTVSEAKEIKVKDPSPENLAIAAVVIGENEKRLDENPDLIEINKQIAELNAQVDEARPEMQKCLENINRTSKLLDFKREDMSAQPFEFTAIVDGKPRTFELSHNQFTHGDFGGVDKSTTLANFFGSDKKLVKQAYEKAFKDSGSTDPDKPLRVEVVMGTENKTFKVTREQIEAGYKGDEPMSFAQRAAIKDAAEAALAESDAKNMGAPKNPGEEIEFELAINETRIFHQSIAEIRAGEFGGLYFFEVNDKANVVAAGLKQYHENMMSNPEYAEQYAQYNRDAARLVGQENTFNKDTAKIVGADQETGLPTMNFGTHRNTLNMLANLKYGDFGQSVYNHGMNVANLEWEAKKITDNIEDEVHIVKKSDIDALDPNDPNKEMVAESGHDPALTTPPI